MISVTESTPPEFSRRIALISAPWPLFSRPSIQLGVLKGYLQGLFPDVTVSCYHFFLSLAEAIGYPVYHAISGKTWLAESIYAALLYPESKDRIGNFFARQAKKVKELGGLEFSDLTRRVKTVSDGFVQKTDWSNVGLVGLSVCLCQMTASLYFIREIRRSAPDLPLIAGGSIIGGQTAYDILTMFPDIDLIVTGEGEQPLARIVSHLLAGGRCEDLPATRGVIGRNNKQSKGSAHFWQLPDLKTLPVPDFSDYFDLLEELPVDKRFFPTLPVEISRGCWWRSAKETSHREQWSEGCAFCNLNLQWHGYRTKAGDQVVGEIDQLTEKYKVLSVAIVDNVLPPKKSLEIFTGLAEKNKDFHFFAEIRASAGRRMLENLYEAGMTEVQIGIESLSSRLLKKLNKGITAMDNMEIMKHCEALGITNAANLILHFPGSDETDVAETLRTIRFARFFRPLRIVSFWLGIHSQVWENPKKYGLTAVFNHPYHKELFPEAVCRRMHFNIQDYRGPKIYQRRLWQQVAPAIRKWRKDYSLLHSNPYDGPILTQHDGQSFLIVRERRLNEEPLIHRLQGASRKIYLFCEHHRSFEEIKERFSQLQADKIRSFLNTMINKGLMFDDYDQYLSLAVPTHRSGRRIAS
ncbi:conserved hypothetical protein [uncultured Desulfobacterium sp.]|uniref:B12-binding domain-containing protein n=1 Tax=uncultured Desulfobacterium sp. TaxID=201089 RepID=A0A445MU64_9BACT|nr:conserved hypothetical protein [uncultured Desulfobacterium sp.]